MTECVGFQCVSPACRCRRQVGKSGIARAYMELAVSLVGEEQIFDAEWRFRQHMTGEHGATLVFYDEAVPAPDLPDWLFEAPASLTRSPAIPLPAPKGVDRALVQHLDGSLWSVPWRGAGHELPKPTFFSPAFTPDPACWERRVLGDFGDESEGA